MGGRSSNSGLGNQIRRRAYTGTDMQVAGAVTRLNRVAKEMGINVTSEQVWQTDGEGPFRRTYSEAYSTGSEQDIRRLFAEMRRREGIETSSDTDNYKGVIISQRPSGKYELRSPVNGTRRIFNTLAEAHDYIDNAEDRDFRARRIR